MVEVGFQFNVPKIPARRPGVVRVGSICFSCSEDTSGGAL